MWPVAGRSGVGTGARSEKDGRQRIEKFLNEFLYDLVQALNLSQFQILHVTVGMVIQQCQEVYETIK